MVVGGPTKEVEILDTENERQSCSATFKFPNEVHGASGGMTDIGPVICGGQVGSYQNFLTDQFPPASHLEPL